MVCNSHRLCNSHLMRPHPLIPMFDCEPHPRVVFVPCMAGWWWQSPHLPTRHPRAGVQHHRVDSRAGEMDHLPAESAAALYLCVLQCFQIQQQALIKACHGVVSVLRRRKVSQGRLRSRRWNQLLLNSYLDYERYPWRHTRLGPPARLLP